MSKFKILPLCLAVLSTGLLAVEVQAQEVRGNQIEEVVVTARKRAESLQEVPLSITPFSSETMERRDLVNLEDIANNTIGLTYAAGSTSGFQESPTIRGLRQGFLQDRVQNVATFLDGIYLSRSSMANMGMVDMQRIEVVKGPQNSLYGRNAFAGAINYVTKKPEDEFNGYVSTTQGSDNREDWKISVTGPLWTDKLLGRASWGKSEFDGHTDNKHPYAGISPGGGYTNGGGDKRLGGYDDKTYDLALTFHATDSLTFDASYYNTDLQRESQPSYILNGVSEVANFMTTPYADMNSNPVRLSTLVRNTEGGSDVISVGNTLWKGDLPLRVAPGAWVGGEDPNTGTPQLDWGYGIRQTSPDSRITGMNAVEDPRGYGMLAESEIVSFGFDWDINEDWSAKYLYGWIDHDSSQQGPASRDPLFGTTVFDVTNSPNRVDAYIQSNAFASRPIINQTVDSHEFRFDWSGNDFMAASFGVFYSDTEDHQTDVTDFNGICTTPEKLIDQDQNPVEACASPVSGAQADTPYNQAEALGIFVWFGDQWHGSDTNSADFTEEVWSAFGSLEFFLTSDITLRVEGRYTEEDKEITRDADIWGLPPGGFGVGDGSLTGPIPFISAICAPGESVNIEGESCIPYSQKNTWDYFTPKVNIDWQLGEDYFLYAYAAKGLKAGGFNNTSVISQSTFDEETNWTFELGSKNTFFDGSLQLNGAVYYVYWEDLQGSQAPKSSEFSPNANAVQANIGDITNYGIDIDGIWVIGGGFSVDFGAAYTNPKYEDDVEYDEAGRYFFNGCTAENLRTDTDVDGSPIGGNFDDIIDPGELCGDTDVGGHELPKVSKYQALLGLSYGTVFDTGWDLRARIGGNYQSKQYLTSMNEGYIPSRTLWDANVSLNAPEHWEFIMWGKNIFDKEYVSSAFNLSLFNKQIVTYGAGITYGATVKYNFF